MENKKPTLEFQRVKDKAPSEQKRKTKDKGFHFLHKGIIATVLTVLFLIGAVIIEILSVRGEISSLIATGIVAILVICSLIVVKVSKK